MLTRAIAANMAEPTLRSERDATACIPRVTNNLSEGVTRSLSLRSKRITKSQTRANLSTGGMVIEQLDMHC